MWFKCDIWGAVDFDVFSSGRASVKVYRKTLFSKNEHFSQTGSSFTLKKTLSDCSINNSKNTYLVHVSGPGASNTVRCTIKTHVDTYTNQNGALWTPKDKTAVYNPDILVLK